MTSPFDWLRPTFEKLDNVQSVHIDGALMEATRTDTPLARVGFSNHPTLDAAAVDGLVSTHGPLNFVVNVPKNGRILGDAIERAAALGLAVGGVGDAMRAMHLSDPGQYEFSELTFVLRGIRQHSRVTAVSRLDDKRLSIERAGLSKVTVFICSDYQPTADAVRVAIDRYGPFDIFVATNPNSAPSSEAIAAAQSAGRQLHRWGAFLGALNRP